MVSCKPEKNNFYYDKFVCSRNKYEAVGEKKTFSYELLALVNKILYHFFRSKQIFVYFVKKWFSLYFDS